jgi:hypothetical protein
MPPGLMLRSRRRGASPACVASGCRPATADDRGMGKKVARRARARRSRCGGYLARAMSGRERFGAKEKVSQMFKS